ncbi:MAG: VCBS repeat-containing protein, partial [Planctomycetales bacterium]|nr:VCBS repeat-containing protein [Planctomycetales bacterium]
DGNGQFQGDADERIEVGEGSRFLIASHLNGDEFLDLATANAESGTVSVLLNDGAGAFRSELDLDVGPGQPRAIVADDFDRDGHIDLAIAKRGTNDIMVATGDGTGTFQLVTINDDDSGAMGESISVQARTPWHISAGDFNEDGRPDLVTANRNSSFLSVLTNMSKASSDRFVSFVPSTINLGTSAQPSTEIRVAGDANPVTVTATHDNQVRVDGTAAVQASLARGPLVAELNGDGKSDLVTVNRQGEIEIRLTQVIANESTRYLLPQVLHDSSGRPLRASDVAICSDTSGSYRLAMLDRDSNAMLVYSLQLAAGGVIGVLEHRETSLQLPTRLISADINDDMLVDLVVADGWDDSVTMFVQQSDGRLVASLPLPVGDGPVDIYPVESRHDAAVDLLVVNQLSGDISHLRNDGHGHFEEVARKRSDVLVYGLSSDGTQPWIRALGTATGITAGDFDGDGWSDVLVANSVSSHASLLIAGRDGLADASPMLLSSPAIDVLSSDLDGDGNLDAAFLHELDSSVSVHWGDGAGGFETGPVIQAGNAPVTMNLNDIDHDGLPELLVVNQFGDILALTVDVGGREFEEFHRIDRSASLAVADSVVVAHRSSDNVSLDGQAYQLPQPETLDDFQLFAPEDIHFADVNLDAIPDIVVANGGNTTEHDVIIYLGRRDGGFDKPLLLASDDVRFANPVSIAPADLDGDSDMDLVITNQGANTVSVLVNLGVDGLHHWNGFDLRQVIDLGDAEGNSSGAVSTVIVDATGDGWLDLLVTNSQAANVELIEGSSTGKFRRTGNYISVTGPTSKQGAVVIGDQAYVVLSDGGIAGFRLDSFQSPDVQATRLELPPDQFIVAIQPVDGLASSLLFATGFELGQGAFVSLLAHAASGHTREIARWNPEELREPTALNVIGSIVEGFQVIIAQDSLAVPFIRFVTPAMITWLMESTPVIPTQSSFEVPESVGNSAGNSELNSPPVELELASYGATGFSVPVGLAVLVNAVSFVAGVVKSGVQMSVDAVMPVSIQSLAVAASNRIPVVTGATTIELVGWLLDPNGQGDEQHSKVAKQDIQVIVDDISRRMLGQREQIAHELKSMLVNVDLEVSSSLSELGQWLKPVDTLLSSLEWMWGTLIGFGHHGHEERDMSPDEHFGLRDYALALGATGAAGLVWHFYDRRKTPRPGVTSAAKTTV